MRVIGIKPWSGGFPPEADLLLSAASDLVADILGEGLPPKTGHSLRRGQVTQSGPHQPVDAAVKTAN